MKTIKSNLTQKEAAIEVIEILNKFHTSNMMDITVGWTADGQIDYEYDVHGGDIIIPIAKTGDGNLGDMVCDLEKENLSDEEVAELSECFSPGCWGMNTDGEGWDEESQDFFEIEIEFADEV